MGDFRKACGVIPWKEGDELPEDVIRRLRDNDPSNLIVQQFAEEVNKLETQNAALLKALKEIAKAEGPYSQDRLTHAENTISHLTLIASQAIAEVEGRETDARALE